MGIGWLVGVFGVLGFVVAAAVTGQGRVMQLAVLWIVAWVMAGRWSENERRPRP